MEKTLPAIPAKRYFTIGEVSDLCGVKPYVLRYWEQEFTQLKPMKRRGNRRYYQHHEVLLIRRIRELLYEQGFTISGARNRLTELVHARNAGLPQDVTDPSLPDEDSPLAELVLIDEAGASTELPELDLLPEVVEALPVPEVITTELSVVQMRQELISIRGLLLI